MKQVIKWLEGKKTVISALVWVVICNLFTNSKLDEGTLEILVHVNGILTSVGVGDKAQRFIRKKRRAKKKAKK